MKTAEEKSNYYIWYVLDKIMRGALPNQLGEVTYTFNKDVTRTNPISYGDERNALTYLFNNNVIKKVGEDVLAEGGEKGTRSYYVEEIYRLRVKKRFYDYYDLFYIKVFGLEEKKDKKIWNRIIQNIIKSLTGEYEKQLILLLSKGDKTAKDLEETGAKAVRHLIKNTNEKIKKFGLEITITKIRDLNGLRKYHLTIS